MGKDDIFYADDAALKLANLNISLSMHGIDITSDIYQMLVILDEFKKNNFDKIDYFEKLLEKLLSKFRIMQGRNNHLRHEVITEVLKICKFPSYENQVEYHGRSEMHSDSFKVLSFLNQQIKKELIRKKNILQNKKTNKHLIDNIFGVNIFKRINKEKNGITALNAEIKKYQETSFSELNSDHYNKYIELLISELRMEYNLNEDISVEETELINNINAYVNINVHPKLKNIINKINEIWEEFIRRDIWELNKLTIDIKNSITYLDIQKKGLQILGEVKDIDINLFTRNPKMFIHITRPELLESILKYGILPGKLYTRAYSKNIESFIGGGTPQDYVFAFSNYSAELTILNILENPDKFDSKRKGKAFRQYANHFLWCHKLSFEQMIKLSPEQLLKLIREMPPDDYTTNIWTTHPGVSIIFEETQLPVPRYKDDDADKFQNEVLFDWRIKPSQIKGIVYFPKTNLSEFLTIETISHIQKMLALMRKYGFSLYFVYLEDKIIKEIC